MAELMRNITLMIPYPLNLHTFMKPTNSTVGKPFVGPGHGTSRIQI